MQSRDSTLAAGEIIGPYVVRRVLGAGAFGVVYEAVKQPLEKRVALKLLRRDLAGDPALTARFLREAQAAASLKHPNIVEVDDAGAIDGVPFLAMEFLDGQSLADRIDYGGPMSVEGTMDLMLPVCSAVAAVHERGIIHRDLKPDNIFLWQSLPGQVQPKLLDFGIAKLRTQTQERALTATGTMFGTPKYMPPEQWSDSKNTIPQSDQWALAVIVFECITAHTPYDANDIPALVLKMSTEPPRSLRELVPDAPYTLDQVLQRALARDPSQRFGSVREFARALLPFASDATRARWSTEFAAAGGLDRASTMGIESFADSPRKTLAAVQSPTLQRSAMEVPVREVPGRSTRARLGAAALAVGALVAVVLGVTLLDREPPRAAASGASAAQRTELPPHVVEPAPASANTPPPPSAPAAVAAPTAPPAPVAVAAPTAPVAPVAAAVVAAHPAAPVASAPPSGRRSRRSHRRGADSVATPGLGEIPNL